MDAPALYICALLSFVPLVFGQNSVPVITNVDEMDNRYISESAFKIGDVVGRVQANDPDGTNLLYFLQGNGGEYFSIGRDDGVVTLKKELDFETDPEIRSTIIVVDGDGQRSSVTVKLFVNDENDNAPVFADYGIFVEISEDEPAGYSVTDINVSDLDTKNEIISVYCNGSSALFADACQKFGLRKKEGSNKYWRGELVLKQQLNYEERISYAILLTTYDGKYYVSNEIHVEVADINDSPPRFIRATPSIIDEEEPVGTVFQTIVAIDQDTTNASAIRYELIGENLDKFAIGAESGDLSNIVRLDYDNVNFPRDSPFELTIKAREVQPDGSLGNDPITTATVNILVTVLDINDNTPTFAQPSYEVSVDENIVSGANIPGLQMTVTDIDSGTFNSFDLVTLDHQDVFQIIPNSDSASSSATLFIVDGRKIDYESVPPIREYIVRVEARQNKVPNPQRTGTTTVTIKVNDVNDETPRFPDSSYTETVSELAGGGFRIIDLNAVDDEEGPFGTAGIKYQLFGNIPPHFAIDRDTGVVTVANCATPGEEPCIDYERKKSYLLTVSATDNNGGQDGRTRSVQLTINVRDENDNAPTMESSYVRYINENSQVTINPLRIDASDPDTVGGPITYKIEGDSTNLWQVVATIDPATGQRYGNITAIRPILYEDAPDQVNGQFKFAVVVTDTKYTTNADVTINVLDINNNAPEFSTPEFVESIREDTGGEVYVISVTATDGDAPTTGNGILDITVGEGGRGKFYARETTRQAQTNFFVADIYTTKDATFDFEAENVYDMTLIVRDRGTPSSKQGTGKLKVYILDINNRDPVIRPSFQSITVSENTPLDRVIHQVSATDPDDDRDLRFSFQAASATDGNGAQVDTAFYDFTRLFRMDDRTGEVLVNSGLDRDSAASITFNLLVRDVAANPVQEGTGILLIHITEFNDQPPQFNTTQYNIVISEELNINSFIQNLYCTDDDDKIDSYSLFQDDPRQPNFFSFYSTSGAMLVENRIDYDRPNNIRKIELTAFCTDTGTPQLTASTKVIVTVTNINDNYPVFGQDRYSTSINEGGNIGGPLNLDIGATDLDSGDYGNLRYALLDTNSDYDRFFTIDPITAVISVSNQATFDREKTGFLGLQVEAYDSPNDARVRLRSTVPVYITILDVNDNCPVFSQSFGYNGTVPESADPDTSIIDTIATDEDEGINNDIVFTIKSGSGRPAKSENLFTVGRTNGRVMVREYLKGQAGMYSFTLVATDRRGNNDTGTACATEVPIYIEIQQTSNDAPKWIRPPKEDWEIYVLESQYEGMLVYSAKASDTNTGPNGVVDYYFNNGGQQTQNTAEFRINRISGVIRAEIEFDREERDEYILKLLAKDRGNPSASSEITLRVKILDVDDNDPMFPMKNGVVEMLNLPQKGIVITDGSPPPGNGGYIGQCIATDADSKPDYISIFYDILAAEDEVRNYISVDRESCNISLTRSVDYDTHPTLEFDIIAYNEKNDDAVRRYKRAANPSIQHVIINIQDSNDNAPVFKQQEYFGCISYDAPFNKTILEVGATDKDQGSRITYSLDSQSRVKGFAMESTLGTLYNTRSLRDAPRANELTVIAFDGVNSATSIIKVLVTSPSNVVKLKIDRALTDVQPFSQQLVNTLISSSGTGVDYACIDKMHNHVNEDGDEVLTATDVFVAGARRRGGSFEVYPAEELADILEEEIEKPDSPYSAIFATRAEVEGDDDGFSLKEDAVLAVFIIALLLVVMALILVCIACYCIRRKDKKKKRKIRASRHAVIKPVEEPTVTSFNPVYDNKGDRLEAEYSTVSKVRPAPTPIAPVVIPAPVSLEPLESSALPPPQDLRPVEPEEPVPVIETEVMPDESPAQHMPAPEPPVQFQPEYEDRIETEVVDEPIHPSELPPPPPEADDTTIEVVIDDSVDVTLLPPPHQTDEAGPTVIQVQAGDD